MTPKIVSLFIVFAQLNAGQNRREKRSIEILIFQRYVNFSKFILQYNTYFVKFFMGVFQIIFPPFSLWAEPL